MTFSSHLALLAIRIYQGAHLAFFRNCCRFHPTCSDYAAEAIQVHGALKGSLLTARRILRCQPLCKGGWDPVPPAGTGSKRGAGVAALAIPRRILPSPARIRMAGKP